MPLNATAVTPLKFVPVIVTLVPVGPLVGEKPVKVGAVLVAPTSVLMSTPTSGVPMPVVSS